MRIFSGKRGVALLIVLAMVTIISIMAATFLSVSGQDYLFARDVAMRCQTQYLAEGGIEFAQIKRVNWLTYPKSIALYKTVDGINRVRDISWSNYPAYPENEIMNMGESPGNILEVTVIRVDDQTGGNVRITSLATLGVKEYFATGIRVTYVPDGTIQLWEVIR
ncbi:MAG: hypothetical protein K8T10_02835 [Candidatus Eremiobacteraeota bacterium]|nr:hypothetical protein [Candidatus Eremiobacteraeota bacterium]